MAPWFVSIELEMSLKRLLFQNWLELLVLNWISLSKNQPLPSFYHFLSFSTPLSLLSPSFTQRLRFAFVCHCIVSSVWKYQWLPYCHQILIFISIQKMTWYHDIMISIIWLISIHWFSCCVYYVRSNQFEAFNMRSRFSDITFNAKYQYHCDIVWNWYLVIWQYCKNAKYWFNIPQTIS